MVVDGRERARCTLWWNHTPTIAGGRLGTIGALSGRGPSAFQPTGGDAVAADLSTDFATDLTAARTLLDHACRRLETQGCTQVLAPMNGSSWQPYRCREPMSPAAAAPDPLAGFAGEPLPGPEWIAPLSRCGFRVLQRYHSFLCNDLTQRRRRGRPTRLETLRICRASELDATAGLAQVQALLPQVHGLLHRAFQRQPWFLPLPLDTFCRLQLQSGGLASIDPHSSLLAFAGEQLVGLLLAHPADASGTTLVIRTLAVLPGRPWAGLGRLLLEQAHAAAQQRGFRQVVHALMLENGAGQALSRHYARPLRSYVLLGRRLGPGPGE
ncbi:GNAT family N-acetyltransferase [Synechococcus sp. CCY9202]|uniref:GNAT family N-acetyltransferase n=1 Tax=Synechococcus sp. CCY9202 TaxID=174698 RepID=UPI002B1F4622|nr:GNAT family N-acetyltransferase [Synechococcus sp. CCY9202]MEA5422756.1 GNAT family N-acetyltransferase [Synechococcus sp. CCY9202]